jgi:hypothetical protein
MKSRMLVALCERNDPVDRKYRESLIAIRRYAMRRSFTAVCLLFPLLIGACASMRTFWYGDPDKYAARNVFRQYDKFTGKHTLTGYIGRIGDDYTGLTLSWNEGDAFVSFSWLRNGRAEGLLPDAQRIGFDLSADNTPIQHSAAVHEYKVDKVYSEDILAHLSVVVAVPLPEVKRLVSVREFEIRVCEHEQRLGSFDVGIVKEFARRLCLPVNEATSK